MDIMASDAVVIERDEVWGVNAAGAVINVDLSFAMDDYLTCVNRTPAFAKWFETAKEPFFTSQPRNPNALAYPLQEVLSMPGARPYFNGSVSYIAAYAALIGVKELTIFGCDYLYGGMGRMHPRQSETVARYMACMSWWLGFCQAKGMGVVITPSSPLLDADLNLLEQFYGYIVKPFIQHANAPDNNLPDHLGGSATSLMFGTQSGFSMAMPLVGGMLADAYGLVSIFYMLAGTILVTNILTLGLPNERPETSA